MGDFGYGYQSTVEAAAGAATQGEGCVLSPPSLLKAGKASCGCDQGFQVVFFLF